MSLRDPDKNRFLKAINHIESQDVPFFEIDPDMSIANKILEKDFPMSSPGLSFQSGSSAPR